MFDIVMSKAFMKLQTICLEDVKFLGLVRNDPARPA
jgi:hypothetical protein